MGVQGRVSVQAVEQLVLIGLLRQGEPPGMQKDLESRDLLSDNPATKLL